MRTSLLIAFLIALMISGLAFVVNLHFGTAQSGTNVSGIISSVTTWTQANSPYTLTSPVIISYGATLTVQPSVTVNLNAFNLQVNGILSAQGSNDNNIVFDSTGGNVLFTGSSISWNEQAGTGCIIENSIFNDAAIFTSGCSPKLDNNTINDSGNNENGAIYMEDGAPVISNNIVYGDISCLDGAAPTVTGNFIHGGVSGEGFDISAPVIINNTIEGGTGQMVPGTGIYDDGSNYYIANNTIFGCYTGISVDDGIATIVGNFILNNTKGIYLGEGVSTILHNTICNNTVGLSGSENSGSVAYNNLVSNSQYTLSGNLTYNWWGTTNQQTIAQILPNSSIFVPFLTAPDPQAPAIPNISTPTTPSPSPTSSSSVSPSPSSTPAQTSTADSLSNSTPIPTSTQTPSITQNSPTEQPASSPSQPSTSIPEFSSLIFLTFLTASLATATLIIIVKWKHEK